MNQEQGHWPNIFKQVASALQNISEVRHKNVSPEVKLSERRDIALRAVLEIDRYVTEYALELAGELAQLFPDSKDLHLLFMEFCVSTEGLLPNFPEIGRIPRTQKALAKQFLAFVEKKKKHTT